MQFAGGSLPPRGKLSGLRQCRKFTDNIRMNASAEQRKNLPMSKFYICHRQIAQTRVQTQTTLRGSAGKKRVRANRSSQTAAAGMLQPAISVLY